jgi:hypothetical protein
MLSLWRDWLAGKGLPHGFAPWRVVFSQLRDLRPWGPRDRVTSEDLAVSAEEHADENGKVRLELELVFRAQGDAAEATAIEALQNVGGELISRSRVAGAGYHALLVEVPQAELVRVRARENAGLVAEESIFSTSTTRSSALEHSSRTGRLTTGLWTPLARPTWARGLRSS